MKFKNICLSSMLIYGMYSGIVSANTILTSKTYVDNKVPGYNPSTGVQSVLTDTTTTGSIAKRNIFDGSATYVASTHSGNVPTMGAVMSAISGGTTALPWNTAEQNATGAYSTTFAASGTNVWPTADSDKVVKGQTFANALATKQNKIGARATKIENSDTTFAPSVVINTTTDGSVGQMAILTDEYIGDNGFNLSEFNYRDDLIPTAAAVGSEIYGIWSVVSNLQYNIPAGTNGYLATHSGTAGTFGTPVNPTTFQSAIPAATTPTGLYTDGSVVTHTSTDGTVGERHIIDEQVFNDLVNGTASWNTEYQNMLITAGSVGVQLRDKQTKIPAGTNGYLATHSGTAGTFGTPVNPTTFQSAIPAKATKIDDSDTAYAPSVVTNTTTAGTVGQMAILTRARIVADNADMEAYEDPDVSDLSSDEMIPTVGAVLNELEFVWDTVPWNQTAENAVNNYSTTFNGTTNNWPSGTEYKYVRGNSLAGGLSLKQNKIGARATKILNTDTTFAPSVVTNTTTEGTVGQMGILTGNRVTLDGEEGALFVPYQANGDNLIPTVSAVKIELTEMDYLKQNTVPKSGYKYIGANQAYNTNAATDNKSWLNADVAGTGLVTRTATDGTVGERKIFEASSLSGYSALTGNNKLIADISIPTVGAMMSAISSGITAAAPTGTANTIANYDSTGALGSGIATYTGSTTYNATNDSTKIPTMAGVTAYAQAKIPAGTNGYLATHSGTAGTFGTPVNPTTFQSAITTGLVSLGDNWIEDLPAIVSYDETSGLVGNKYGILDYTGSTDYLDDGWNNYQEDTETNHLIPTVGAIGRELQLVRNSIPDISGLQTKIPAGTNGYLATHSGTAGTFGTPVNPATFQAAIDASEWEYYNNTLIPGVVVSTDTDGVVAQRMILDKTQYIGDSSVNELVGGETRGIMDDIHGYSVTAADINSAVPTTTMTVAIANAAAAKRQAKIPAGTNGYLATHSGTAGTFGTPVNPTTFQSAIPARATKINEDDERPSPSVVANTTTAGTVGQMAILTRARIVADDADMEAYDDGDISDLSSDDMIPTVGAVLSELEFVWDTVPWNQTAENAVNNYSTTFNGTTNNWPSGTEYKFVRGDALVGGLSLKQNKIGARATKILNTDTTFAPSVVTNTTTAGTVGQMAILEGSRVADDGTEGSMFSSYDSDNLIPTVSAVKIELTEMNYLKQNKVPKSGYSATGGAAASAYNNNAASDSKSWLNANVAGTGLMTKTATDGTIGERKIFEASSLSGYSALTGNNKLIADISIPTVGAMMSAISNGITAAAPTGTANTIANYDANGALGSGIATYDGSTTYNATNDSTKIPTMAGVTAYAQSKIPAGTNGYLATHSGTAGTFGTPVNPTTFQSAIPARATKIEDSDTTPSPSVVTNTTTAGTVGQMAILTRARIVADDADMEAYDDGDISDLSSDDMIPTVGAVLSELEFVWDTVPWNQTAENAVNNYSTTFNGTTNNWPSGTEYKFVRGDALVGGLSLKQNKVPKSGYSATGGAAANAYNNNAASDSKSWLNANVAGTGLMTRTATDGTIGERKIFEASSLSGYSALTGNNKLIADISIPTVGAMMSAISNGITAAAPTGTANTIANYDANGALGSGIATYTGAAAYNATNDSTKIPTMAGVTAYAQAKIPAGTNGYLATHSGTAGTFGTPVNPTTFQSAIPARATKIEDNDATPSPSVVTNTTTAGTVGQMAILTNARMTSDTMNLEDYVLFDESYDADALIPTVAAVQAGIDTVYDNVMPWDASEVNAANAYSTTFSNSATNAWPNNDRYRFIAGQTFVNALALKQNIIDAKASGAADSVITDSDTAGVVQKREIATSIGTNASATTIPTTGAIVSAFNSKFPAKGSGDQVVILGSSAGSPSSRSIVTAINSSNSIPTSGAVKTRVENALPAAPDDALSYAFQLSSKSPYTTALYGPKNGTTGSAVPHYMAMEFGVPLTSSGTIPVDRYIMGITSLSNFATDQGLKTTDDVVAAVPSLKLIADAYQSLNTAINTATNALPWNTAEQNAVNAYNTTFANSGTNVWPLADSDKVVKGQTFANALATKQNKLAANNASNNPNGSLVAYGNTAGTPGIKKIVTTVASGGTDIPTDGAVYTAVDARAMKPTCTTTKASNSSVCYTWTFADVGTIGAKLPGNDAPIEEFCVSQGDQCDGSVACCNGMTCSDGVCALGKVKQ